MNRFSRSQSCFQWINRELEITKPWIIQLQVKADPSPMFLVSPWANVFWIEEFLWPLFFQRIHWVDDGPRVPHEVNHVEVVSADPPLVRELLQYPRHLSHWKADCLDDPEVSIVRYQLTIRRRDSQPTLSWFSCTLFPCVLRNPFFLLRTCRIVSLIFLMKCQSRGKLYFKSFIGFLNCRSD